MNDLMHVPFGLGGVGGTSHAGHGGESGAGGVLVRTTVYNPNTAEYLVEPPLSVLDRVPELLADDKAFIARNLVMQAQADYKRALERGNKAAADAAAQRRDVEYQRGRADLAEARIRELERKVAELTPRARERWVSPLFAGQDPVRTSGELRWPWLVTSWALVVAGVVVCVL